MLKTKNNKILLLIKTPPPITGATLMNLTVKNSLALKHSFKIDSISMSYANSVSDMGSINIRKILLFFKYLSMLIGKILKNKYKFIYFQISPCGSAFFRDFLFLILLKLFRVKVVFHLHGKGIKVQAKKKLFRFLYKFTFKNEFVIITSKLVKYDIEDVCDSPVFIIPNAIPDINYEYKKINNKPSIQILFLSNLLKSKGIDDFFEVVRKISTKNINIKSKIIGAEGDYSEVDILRKIEEYNLKNCLEYLGPLYNEEKNKVLKKTDILIYPTLEDIWGNVNLEAMQNGVPVIATKEGAIPEIIDDKVTGYLVEKNSPDQIVEKIELLYNNRELLHKLGRSARKKYENRYRIEVFEGNLKNLFQKICSNI